MADKNSKKNFQARVIAKLFGEADEDIYDQDDTTSGNSTEEDCIAAASSTSLVSSEVQVRDVPFYGVHCTFPGQKEKCIISNISVNGASESADSCDGESENCVPRKRRRRRKGHPNLDRTGKEVTPSTSDTPPTSESVCNTTISLPMASASRTKNQKRKVKKKRRDKEKRAQSSSSIEFIFDSQKPDS